MTASIPASLPEDARKRDPATLVIAIAAALFVAWSLYVIAREAVYIPYWDQWGWLRRYYAPEEPFLRLAFRPINGHIVALPLLVYVADIVLTGASNVLNLLVLILALAGTCLVLRAGFARLPIAARRDAGIYTAVAFALLFWLYGWQNLFWPFQLHQCVAVLLGLAGLLVLSRAALQLRPDGHATLALALGLASSLSFGVGLAFWPAAALMVLTGNWPRAWKLRAIVVAVSIVGIIGYCAVAFSPPPAIQQTKSARLLSLLNFVPLYLGAPLYVGGNTRVLETSPGKLLPVLVAGYAGIALAGWALVRVYAAVRERALTEGAAFFAGVVVFMLATGAMGALARSGGAFASSALASRYGMYCMLFWLALFPLLAYDATGARRLPAAVVRAGAAIVLVFVAVTQVSYIEWWLGFRTAIARAQASLVSGVPDEEYLAYVFVGTRPQFVRDVTRTLLDHRVTALYEERSAYIGHAVGAFGSVVADCSARTGATKQLGEGTRFDGTIARTQASLSGHRVYVADAADRVVGLGEVERAWHGFGATATNASLRWTAYAPAGAGDPASLRVYVDTGSGLCAVARTS